MKIIGGVGVKNSYNYVFAPYNPNKTDGDMLMGLGAYPGFVTLADGTAVSVLKNNGRLNVLVDINGMEKPNRSGYDVFFFCS